MCAIGLCLLHEMPEPKGETTQCSYDFHVKRALETCNREMIAHMMSGFFTLGFAKLLNGFPEP